GHIPLVEVEEAPVRITDRRAAVVVPEGTSRPDVDVRNVALSLKLAGFQDDRDRVPARERAPRGRCLRRDVSRRGTEDPGEEQLLWERVLNRDIPSWRPLSG